MTPTTTSAASTASPDSIPTTDADLAHEHDPKESRRALISSFLGSTVEYYDFLLYGAAAGLVFPHLFFAEEMDKTIGTILSFTILLAGYLTRPIGGLLFGHFGDRFGRKNMLFITMMMMGFVSVAIGLLPTYADIGVAAPLALVMLRIVQGIAVGGEWAGATLMAAEHVKQGNRGFAASIAVTGGPAGAVLSTLVLGLFAGLPTEDFLSWGWRIPFLLSATLVIIGLYLRLRVKESPEFARAREEGEVRTGVPLFRVLREYPLDTLYGILAVAGPLFLQALLAIWAVPFVVSTGVMDRQAALMFLTLSSFLHVFAIPFFAWLSDRFGRKPVMLVGGLISVALVFPMFWMFQSGNPALVSLAFILGNPIMQASMYGPCGAFLAEKFDTAARYTGVSLTYQGGSIIGAGVAPLVATWLMGLENGLGTTNIAIYFIAITIVSALAILLSKETHPRSARDAE